MSYIDANYVRANRILPTSLSSGGSTFSETTGGSGYGVLGGGIVQVVWGRFDSRTSVLTSSSGTRIGPSVGWQVEIVPRSSSNKILVYVQWSGEIIDTHNMVMGITRRNVTASTYTDIGPTSGDGSRNSGIAPPYMSYAAGAANNVSSPEGATYWTLDQPNTTNTLQYMPWVRTRSNRTMYLGRTVDDLNQDNREAMINTMMAWEVSF